METPWNAHWRFECEHGILSLENDVVYIDRLADDGDRNIVEIVIMERQAQDYLLHEFYEAVTQGKPTGTPAQDNIHTVKFVFGVVESCDLGQIVTFDQ